MRGIDVSAHNGEIDWQLVKNDEIDFAIIRAGYGNDPSQRDRFFDRNMLGALRAGIPVGCYWFSYATSIPDAQKEAEICLTVLKPYQDQITWPVFFDYEYDSVRYSREQGVEPDKTLVTDMAAAFLDAISSAGYQAGNYSNLDYCRNWFDMNRLANYPLWFAQYDVNSPSIPCALWQFGGTSVAGCRGSIDTNLADRDLENSAAPVSVQPSSSKLEKVGVKYRVKTQESGWLPEVNNLSDFAGIEGQTITDLAVGVDCGSVRYRVHTKDGNWLPKVSGYDTDDFENGYAGNGTPIDAVAVYYETPNSIRPYRKACYRVSALNGDYYDWQQDNEIKNGQDGYAGCFGEKIDRFQITVR
ncbi:glycoside hydrolase family 25 protein [Caproicibacterium sp. NSD3]